MPLVESVSPLARSATRRKARGPCHGPSPRVALEHGRIAHHLGERRRRRDLRSGGRGRMQERRFGAKDATAAQIVRLAATLPTSGQPRLERLRGFGADFGRALTCVCSRLILADGSPRPDHRHRAGGAAAAAPRACAPAARDRRRAASGLRARRHASLRDAAGAGAVCGTVTLRTRRDAVRPRARRRQRQRSDPDGPSPSNVSAPMPRRC